MSELAPDRIYGQYRNKPKAVAWYGIVPTISQQLCDGAEKVQNTYDIDSNVGAQLDVIGTIVGIPRLQKFLALQDVFQCGDEDAECGAEEVECVGLVESAEVTDTVYRLLLRSKIVKNNDDATIDDIIKGMNFILESDVALTVLDTEDMAFTLQVSGTLTPLERALILFSDLVPKPQGVEFSGLIEITDVVQCGDDTLQCGDSNAECAGFTVI